MVLVEVSWTVAFWTVCGSINISVVGTVQCCNLGLYMFGAGIGPNGPTEAPSNVIVLTLLLLWSVNAYKIKVVHRGYNLWLGQSLSVYF